MQNTFVIYFKYKMLCMYFKHIFEIQVFQILYNIGHHQASGGQFVTPHMVWGCPANSSHLPMHYRFFTFWPWGLPLGQSLPKGEMTYYPPICLPSYKTSARSRKNCSSWL